MNGEMRGMRRAAVARMVGRFLDWIHRLPFRVATKLAVILTGAALIALAIVVTALAFHEHHEVTQTATEDLEAQGEALAPVLASVWDREGESRAREMMHVAKAASPHVSIDLEADRGSSGARTTQDEVETVAVRKPLRSDGHTFGTLVLRRHVPGAKVAISTALETLLFVAIPLAAFAMFVAYVLGEWLVGAPLRRVAEHARHIGEGGLDGRIFVRGSAEVCELKAAINEMSENLALARATAQEEHQRRLEAVNRLRHADRLATVGTLAAGIAHELGTPLNVIALEAQVMERKSGDAERVRSGAALVRSQTARITSIIRQLLDFARRKEPARALEDANDVVASCVSFVAALANARGCTVEIARCDDEVCFDVDRAAIHQVLSNLFVNALDAMPHGGRLVARISRVVRRTGAGGEGGGEAAWVAVAVDDEGVGMDDATRARVFEPFFTTKDVGAGTGLGLSVALGIAEDHGGFIEVESRAGAGTTFTIFLPAASRGHAPDSAREGMARARREVSLLASP